MSLSAAIITALMDAGANREQLAAAMMADIAEREAEAAAKLEAKRAGNRERQRRKRNGLSRNVTPVTRDGCDIPSPQSPPLKTPPDPLKNTPPLTPQPDPSSDDDISLLPEHVFEFYQDLAKSLGLPVPRDFTPERRALVRHRIAQHPLANFHEVFARCRGSPFLRGAKGRTPLTFDWLMEKKNFQKVLEGNYEG